MAAKKAPSRRSGGEKVVAARKAAKKAPSKQAAAKKSAAQEGSGEEGCRQESAGEERRRPRRRLRRKPLPGRPSRKKVANKVAKKARAKKAGWSQGHGPREALSRGCERRLRYGPNAGAGSASGTTGGGDRYIAPREARHDLHQLVGLDWLRQVHLEAGLAGSGGVFRPRVGRQGGGRQVFRTGGRAHRTDQLVAVAARHADIRNQHVGVERAQCRQCGFH